MTPAPSALLAALTLGLALAGCAAEDRARDEGRSGVTTAPSPSAAARTGPRLTPTPPAVAAFVAYAGGGAPEVPWADEVRLSVAGEPVVLLTPAEADRRASWEGCPVEVSSYEGRDCPVSPLRSVAGLAELGAEVVVEPTPPRVVGCTRYRPPAVAGATTTWVRPDRRHRSCVDDLAVAVSVDADGRVVAVDLALSGP